MSPFESLFRRLSPVAFSISFGILKSREEARDVVQEVFAIKILRYQRENPSKSEKELGKIALAMTRNLSIDVFRQRKNRGQLLSKQETQFEESDISERLDINRAMAGLEPRYREVLTLKYVWGLTWEEISKRLGLSVKVARTHAEKATSLVRRSLKEGAEGDG